MVLLGCTRWLEHIYYVDKDEPLDSRHLLDCRVGPGGFGGDGSSTDVSGYVDFDSED